MNRPDSNNKRKSLVLPTRIPRTEEHNARFNAKFQLLSNHLDNDKNKNEDDGSSINYNIHNHDVHTVRNSNNCDSDYCVLIREEHGDENSNNNGIEDRNDKNIIDSILILNNYDDKSIVILVSILLPTHIDRKEQKKLSCTIKDDIVSSVLLPLSKPSSTYNHGARELIILSITITVHEKCIEERYSNNNKGEERTFIQEEHSNKETWCIMILLSRRSNINGEEHHSIDPNINAVNILIQRENKEEERNVTSVSLIDGEFIY